MKITNILRKTYENTLIKNSAYLIMTNLFGMVLGFFFWMMATRFYSPNDIGVVSAILSSMLLISSLSTIGLPTALTLYLPIYSKDANKIINSSIIISIIISTIFSLIFVLGIDIWAPELKPNLDVEVVIVFIIISIITTISLLMAGMFNAGKRSSFQMIKENIFCVIKIIFLVLLAGLGAKGILVSWGIGLIIAMMVGFFLLFKLWRYRPTYSYSPIVKDMARFSAGIYTAGIFKIIPKYVFPLIVIRLISAEATGYFFIAMMIAGVLSEIPESLVGPFLAESSDKNKFWDNVTNAIRLNLLLLIPGLFGVIIFGKIILNIFNPSYAENSFNTIVILCMASIPMSFVTIFNMINNAQKRVAITIKVNIIVSIMVIILSIPLMKIWNIEGIAMAYLITNMIMAGIIIIKTENPIDFALKIIKNNSESDKNAIF